MGQQEVIDILKKERRELSSGEIAKIIGCRPSTVSFLINRLLHYSEIKFREIDRVVAMEKYGRRSRMRVYFL